MEHEYITLDRNDGEKLNCVIKENGSSIWLVFTHGLAEYAERHEHLFKIFSQYFNIFAYDLRGHGKSSGRRGYVDSFNDYVEDLDAVLAFLKDKYSAKRYILMGHSMGGLITSAYLQSKVTDSFYPEKVFLSSPLVAAPGLGTIFKYAPIELTRKIASIKSGIPLAIVRNDRLSHDERIYHRVMEDTFMQKKIHSHLLLELMKACKEVFSKPLRVKCPLYCAIGTGDVIVDQAAVIDYFTNVEKGARLMTFDGAYHELHHEVQKYKDVYLKFLKDSLLDSLFQEGLS